ncbi:MAG TPA: hypothetical protein PKA63_12170 [Oligoflexia bacterium]|nr:hypothetical protein [Oligoflexia bacterium]HMP49411.1 hypothetical protein [Oligoflexia bacterium]
MKKLTLFIQFLLASFASCTGHYNHVLEYSPYEPLRIAVLPFRQVNSEGKLMEEDGELLVDELPLISSEVKDSPVALARQLVLAELKKTPLDVISSSLIDIELPHRNLAYSDGKFNLERIFEVPAKTYCENFLDCDAVLFGTIRKWDRDYYGIQSVNEIEIELKLVSARSDKILFHSRAKDSESRGLTKGPTGYSSLVLEPIKGLDSVLVEDLARRIISQMLSPLKVKPKSGLDTTPPPAIFAVSHDAIDGKLQKDRPLIVLALADAGNTANFTIGNYLRKIPMLEQTPGHYFGEYWPLDGEKFENQTVFVSIKDEQGRETRLEVDRGPVSLK